MMISRANAQNAFAREIVPDKQPGARQFILALPVE
jgi:hypothetical protein